MKKFLLIALLWALPQSPRAQERELPTLAVMADHTLALPLTEISRAYAGEHHMAISMAYVNASEEGSLLAEGAYADILVTARQKWLASLKTEGAVEYAPGREVARGHLALAGSADSTLKMDFTSGFPVAALVRAMNGEPLLALGNPETLDEGSLARESLRHMDVDADLEPYIVYIKSFSQIIQLIAEQGGYGILYASDVQRFPGLKVIALLPESSHRPISYRANVLAGDKMDKAREFIAYLQGAEAQAVFARYGLNLP